MSNEAHGLAGSYPPVLQSFGELLKFLRRRQRLTQRDLALAVGYSEAHICRLEHNQRPPDLATLLALFVPALDLEDEPQWIARLLELATAARNEPLPQQITLTRTTKQTVTEIGVLEAPPPLPLYWVERPLSLQQLQTTLASERCVVLTGLAGSGKTRLAARLAQAYAPQAVFWLTFALDEPPQLATIIRQLAWFVLGADQSIALALLQPSGNEPLPLQQQIAMLQAALAQQPALLCFDNVQLGEPSPQLWHLWTSLAATAEVLLISRRYLPLPGVAHAILTGLSPAESRQLITLLDPDRAACLSQSQQHEVIALTEGNPVMLRLALRQLHPPVAALCVGQLIRAPLIELFVREAVLESLAPATRNLLLLLAVLRQPPNLFDPVLLATSQTADDTAAGARAVAELQRYHLVAQPHRACLAPLVRAFLLDQLLLDARRHCQLHVRAACWLRLTAGDPHEIAYHDAEASALCCPTEVGRSSNHC